MRRVVIDSKCKHGHELTKSNVLFRADGGIRCKTCRNRDEKEYRKRKRRWLEQDPKALEIERAKKRKWARNAKS